MASQFYDEFSASNKSLQERLGSVNTAINKDSAILGWQTRALLQMLNYGLDSITIRAASHLLNLDILNSNSSYLLKLTEGLLLNSIQSITPSHTLAKSKLSFESTTNYRLWSSIGSISLLDGSTVSLVVYDIDTQGINPSNNAQKYICSYCAGNFVEQTLSYTIDNYSVGIFTPIYVSETYKSIWSESLIVKLNGSGDTLLNLEVFWSLPELLSSPNTDMAVLAQHTPRGLTLVLGDGEIYGSGYNSKQDIQSVYISYVKCESLAQPNLSTIQFNTDIHTTSPIPVLSVVDTGDTINSLRSRAIDEFFAAGKITSPTDLTTIMSKIPIVHSIAARTEYNYPMSETIGQIASDTINGSGLYSKLYLYDSSTVYAPGDLVVFEDYFYIATSPYQLGNPDDLNGWARYMSLTDAQSVSSMFRKYYPSASVLDTATIVLSGLILADRKYWSHLSTYSVGDIVYHAGTNMIWLALKPSGQVIEPGSELDVPLWGPESRTWVNKSEALELVSNGLLPESQLSKFNHYTQMTQAIFEAEFKGYFGLSDKLGFVSVCVEPLIESSLNVTIKYKSPYSVSNKIKTLVSDYCCYNVGKDIRADDLNAILTQEHNLNSVYVVISRGTDGYYGTLSDSNEHVQLKSNEYISMDKITISVEERV